MKAYLGYLNQISTEVEEKYLFENNKVNWYHPYKSIELAERREELLMQLKPVMDWKFKSTKPYIHRISRGCEICGQGEWSCLFITGICNASCFYCPARQTSDETPQTQKLLFEDPKLYVDYINKFGFKGVSLSGGEPLMVFERTLEFIRMVRKHCDPEIYVWMYTNGMLITDEKLEKLAKAGLDEIRFDIGAVNYHPKVLKNASSFIPNVTVEIPAVPEHKEQLMEILPTLVEYGVSNLNLHQLRLTHYNAPILLGKNYTYLHGEQPTVAESEITALEIIRFIAENNLNIGVNYCNFQYKNRFQKAGFRAKMAAVLKLEGEEITENGFLRKLELESGEIVALDRLKDLSNDLAGVKLHYWGRVLENLNEDENSDTFLLNGVRYFLVEGMAIPPIELDQTGIQKYLKMMTEAGVRQPEHPLLFEAWQHEFIEARMRNFF